MQNNKFDQEDVVQKNSFDWLKALNNELIFSYLEEHIVLNNKFHQEDVVLLNCFD